MLLYILASPVTLPVMLSRIIGPVRSMARKEALPAGTIPLLSIVTIIRDASEIVGYIKGTNTRDQEYMDEYELHKLRFTSFLAQ